MTLPLVVGLSGLSLSEDERAFLTDTKPLGVILFGRNIEDPRQTAALIEDCRAALGIETWIAIDQEGGRVARLSPPHWPLWPAAGTLGALEADDAEESIYLMARMMADDLHQLGVTVDCWPVLDIRHEGGHQVIGDRAFSSDPERVARLGAAACQGLLDGGVLPVLKHIPGHGRAKADSHLTLPVVDAGMDALRSDFSPFKALADMPVAMTAHVVFTALDGEAPATLSKKVIDDTIRGTIGFGGILISDDIAMEALSGPMADRAAKALEAGCDIVLHCTGKLDEMMAVAEVCPSLSEAARDRVDAAALRLHPPKPFDHAAAEERLRRYLETA